MDISGHRFVTDNGQMSNFSEKKVCGFGWYSHFSWVWMAYSTLVLEKNLKNSSPKYEMCRWVEILICTKFYTTK